MAKRPTLFSLASAAAQRAARRGFGRSPVGQVLRVASSRRSMKTLEQLANRAKDKAVRESLATIQSASGPIRYGLSEAQKGAIDTVLGALGPLGDVLRRVVQRGTSAGSITEKQWEAAVDLIRALGGEILVRPGQRGYERGLEAAKEILREAGVDERKTGSGSPPPPGSPPAGPPGAPTPPPIEPEWTGPRGKRPPNAQDEASMSRIHLTPSSSNVYGFQYDFASSTFYVWFRPPNLISGNVVNVRGKGGLTHIAKAAGARSIHAGGSRRNEPGPLYAYHDVPVRVYKRFLARESAGRAVWDELRVRGSAWGHRFRYTLISGSLVPGEKGQFALYVSRKATRWGFRSRAVSEVGTGKRRYARSGLPERALPNRGLPNRGTPRRGRPDDPGQGRLF